MFRKITTFFRVVREDGIRKALMHTYNWMFQFILCSRTATLILKLIARDEFFMKNVHGNIMYLPVSDTGLSRELILRGTREVAQTEIIKGILKKDMVILEVGANLGYYALIEASIIGEKGKVYAIEPMQKNVEILNRNIKANGYEGIIETFCMAVSDHSGIEDIAVTHQSNLNTMLPPSEMLERVEKEIYQKDVTHHERVKTVTIDEFLKGKRKPDLIRMDIEGYEFRVVDGMIETLKNADKLKLFMELHPGIMKDGKKEVRRLLDKLSALGFKVTHLTDTDGFEQQSVSMENIINSQGSGVFFEKSTRPKPD